jgi:predicted transposase YdaD
MSSTDNEWYITGIQIEVGSVATPFEHRSFGEELALCRRYYYQPDLASDRMISMVLRPDNKRQFQHFFPVQMRADPTSTVTYDADGSSATLSTPVVSKEQFRARTDALSTTTQDPRLTAFKMDSEM